MSETTYTVGDEVTVAGDTYRHRDHLKAAGLEWDADRKLWHGTIERDDWGLHYINLGRKVGLRVAAASLPTRRVTVHSAPSRSHNGPCGRCGTYCYGDCTAD